MEIRRASSTVSTYIKLPQDPSTSVIEGSGHIPVDVFSNIICGSPAMPLLNATFKLLKPTLTGPSTPQAPSVLDAAVAVRQRTVTWWQFWV
jgi:hypothetical protein